MRSTFLLALGLSLLYPVNAAGASSREITLRRECTRDRCVYYKGSKRVFSVEKEEGTSRLIVKDSDRRTRYKVRETEDGTLEIKEPYR